MGTGHPRVRGEHYDWRTKDIWTYGSSPRARGTLCGAPARQKNRRVIPACAGNTPVSASSGACQPGHPRVRGEHFTWESGSHKVYGSSPRARGTPCGQLFEIARRRVIPACAGNTKLTFIISPFSTGHPRVRGEHSSPRATRALAGGSSPRARGTLRKARTCCASGRVIPACAGNTVLLCVEHSDHAGHPRVRGEHRTQGVHQDMTTGSSPRARGTRLGPRSIRQHVRVIPACAGNTREQVAHLWANAGHPRVRGEHRASTCGTSRLCGSSPRARGTRDIGRPHQAAPRVIPACAGNTAPSGTGARRSAGHPRVRGEHVEHAPRIDDGRRVIPACAGNTSPSPEGTARRTGHPRVRGEHPMT